MTKKGKQMKTMDGERAAAIIASLLDEADKHGISPQIVTEAKTYLDSGYAPGNLLTAAIQNNFVLAACRAHKSGVDAYSLASWIAIGFPSDAWGSHDKMRAWMEGGGLLGRMATDFTGDSARSRPHPMCTMCRCSQPEEINTSQRGDENERERTDGDNTDVAPRRSVAVWMHIENPASYVVCYAAGKAKHWFAFNSSVGRIAKGLEEGLVGRVRNSEPLARVSTSAVLMIADAIAAIDSGKMAYTVSNKRGSAWEHFV